MGCPSRTLEKDILRNGLGYLLLIRCHQSRRSKRRWKRLATRGYNYSSPHKNHLSEGSFGRRFSSLLANHFQGEPSARDVFLLFFPSFGRASVGGSYEESICYTANPFTVRVCLYSSTTSRVHLCPCHGFQTFKALCDFLVGDIACQGLYRLLDYSSPHHHQSL